MLFLAAENKNAIQKVDLGWANILGFIYFTEK